MVAPSGMDQMELFHIEITHCSSVVSQVAIVQIKKHEKRQKPPLSDIWHFNIA